MKVKVIREEQTIVPYISFGYRFEACEWAVMMIYSKGLRILGRTYCPNSISRDLPERIIESVLANICRDQGLENTKVTCLCRFSPPFPKPLPPSPVFAPDPINPLPPRDLWGGLPLDDGAAPRPGRSPPKDGTIFARGAMTIEQRVDRKLSVRYNSEVVVDRDQTLGA